MFDTKYDATVFRLNLQSEGIFISKAIPQNLEKVTKFASSAQTANAFSPPT